MSSPVSSTARPTSMRQHWQKLVRRHLWKMDIDDSAWIAPTALIDRTWPRGIHIEAGTIIDEEAVILTHDMTRGLYLDTRIGKNTRVGARAIVLPGISVGPACVIEAGAMVNRDVPAGHRATGNPARVEPL